MATPVMFSIPAARRVHAGSSPAASIVAVLRGANAIPSPTPGFRLAGGDTLIVIGTREGADSAAAILAQD